MELQVYCKGQGSLTIRQKRGSNQGNYTSAVTSSFGPGLTSVRARDLLRVGQAAFLADRAFRRGRRMGQWTRDLRVVVPVEEPRRWKRLAEHIDGLAYFVTHDRWRFEFVSHARERTKPIHKLVESDPSVNLFSSGLDSLCGAAAAFKRGETPVFVTHCPPSLNSVAMRIGALSKALKFNTQAQFANFVFRTSDRSPSGTRSLFPERMRRTRPLLFLSMAGAIALELEIPKIYLNENGVLAVNLPFQPYLHGSRISRHAHPATLRQFEELLRQLWPFDSVPRVINPFFTQTKGEQLAVLSKAAYLAGGTVSCEYAGQQMASLRHWLKARRKPWRRARECGLCSPCLVRRAATHHAGLTEEPGHYVFDARVAFRRPATYNGFPLYRHVQSYVGDLHNFSMRLLRMPASAFVLTYMPEIATLSENSGQIRATVREVYDVYRRFASQVVRFLSS